MNIEDSYPYRYSTAKALIKLALPHMKQTPESRLVQTQIREWLIEEGARQNMGTSAQSERQNRTTEADNSRQSAVDESAKSAHEEEK
jgi:hypothetical protein